MKWLCVVLGVWLGACFPPALPQPDVEDEGTEVADPDIEVAPDATTPEVTECTKDEDCMVLDGTCAVGRCEVGRCVVRAASGSCDDGDKCTIGDRCEDGVCVGDAVICADLNCYVGVCDPETGGCVQNPVEDGRPCDDGDACTMGDRCRGALCEAGDPPDDSVGDWATVFRSTSSVAVAGVAAIGDGLVAAVSVRGGDPLSIQRGGGTEHLITPPQNVGHYIVLARLDASGGLLWAKTVLTHYGGGSSDNLLVVRGGPFVHGETSISLGFMNAPVGVGGEPNAFGDPVGLGIMRLTADGTEVWSRTITAYVPDYADFSFAHVCVSSSGRAGIVFPTFQDELGSLQVTASRDSNIVDDLTSFSSAGLSSGIVTYTANGTLDQVGWVRSDVGEVFGLGCVIRDDGTSLGMGFARGVEIIAEATTSSAEARQSQVVTNSQFAWAAAFSAAGIPTAAAIIQSSRANAKNGIVLGQASAQGAILSGVFQGAVSVVSSVDGTLRSLPGVDPGLTNAAPMAALVEVDANLRLRGGARVEAQEMSWVQTVTNTSKGLVIAGGGRGLSWGPLQSPSSATNYFVASVEPGAWHPTWGFELVDLDNPATGSFSLGPVEVESVSAIRLGDAIVYGATGRGAFVLWPHSDVIGSSGSTVGVVALRNSANGIECSTR